MIGDAKTVKVNWIGLVIRLLFIAALVAVGLALVRHFELLDWPDTVHREYLFLALAMQAAFLLIASLAWKQVLQLCIGLSITMGNAALQIMMVLVGKYLPGKVWGMLSRVAVLKQSGTPLSDGLKASYVEQVVSVHAGLALGALCLTAVWRMEFALLILPVVLASLVLAPRYHDALISLLDRWLPERMAKVARSCALGHLGVRHYARLFGIYIVEWLAFGGILVAIYLVLYGQGAPVSVYLLLLGANSIAMIIGFFALFAPGGIGVRDGVLVLVLTMQLPAAEALALAVFMRAWLTLFDLLTGLAVVLLFRNGPAEADPA
jgi:uncharacterized membrane protein YbhN (UPF0104 family)